jgi:beta-glucosidase
MNSFPQDFVWGAATAAYQIEGATDVDGRGESIWDRFCQTPGKVSNGDTGDRACEHYVRWRDDLDLMSKLGLGGYRFSISWPRIQPEGRGAPNRKGLDFYRRLVDGLLARDIRPLATLYHWDLPQALEDGGGWASRDVVERFADYAGRVFDELGDLVEDWVTHNEPWVTSFLGYGYGTKAPGRRDWNAAVAAAHHSLLAHGVAVRRFRESAPTGRIGITLDLTVAEPASSSREDHEAAERLDGHHNRWFLDAIFRGTYPEDMLAWYESRTRPLDAIHPGDLDTISEPIDFLGVNFYRPNLVAADAQRLPLELREVDRDGEHTAMGWPIVPASLTELLLRLQRDYPGTPYVITENGAAFHDVLDGADVVEDPRRLDYLREHIGAVGRAIDGGADVDGYYAWSLLDNFEWEHGYSQRFGLVYVDYPTQRRVLKRSALWYSELIARQANGKE